MAIAPGYFLKPKAGTTSTPSPVSARLQPGFFLKSRPTAVPTVQSQSQVPQFNSSDPSTFQYYDSVVRKPQTIKSKSLSESLFGTIDFLKDKWNAGREALQGSISNTIGVGINQFANIKGDGEDSDLRKKAQSFKQAGDNTAEEVSRKQLQIQEKHGEKSGINWILGEVASSAPGTVVTAASNIVGTLLTRNPRIGTILGFAPAFAQTTGQAYQDAKEYGVDDREAEKIAMASGFLQGVVESYGMGRTLKLFGKVPGANVMDEQINKNLILEFVKFAVERGGIEGITESTQQVIDNLFKRIYNKEQDLREGVLEAGTVGAFTGLGIGAAGSTTNRVLSGVTKAKTNNPKDIEDLFESSEREIATAINTSPENRSPEQQEIADTFNTQELTPSQTVKLVENQNISETKEGKLLIRSAAQAQELNKNVAIFKSENSDDLQVEVVDKGTAIETTRQKNAGEFLADMPKKIQELRDTYTQFNEEKTLQAEEVLADVWQELSFAEAGQRVQIKNADGGVERMVAKPSSFPKWIPEDLRRKELLDKAVTLIQDGINNISYPEGNRPAQRALMDSIFNQLDQRLGIDTKAIRSDILDSYGKDSKARAKKRADRSGKSESRDQLGENAERTRKQQSKEPVSGSTEGDSSRTKPVNDKPTGSGKTKESRLFKRVRQTLEAEFQEQKVTYNQLSLDTQAEKVTQIINEDPKRAQRIAEGLEEAPSDTKRMAFAIGLAEQIGDADGGKTRRDMWATASLRGTSLGQEIVTLRGNVGEVNPVNVVLQIIRSRKEKIAKQYSDAINNLEVDQKASKLKKADKYIESKVKKLKTETEKSAKSNSAKKVIDDLTCK